MAGEYILCPDVAGLGITVIPVTLLISRSNNVVSAVLLKDVPETYISALEKYGFYSSHEGWMRDVKNVTEKTWQDIFGKNTVFACRPPQHQIPIANESFLAPPAALASAITHLSDEHLTWICKKDSIHGLDNLRRVKTKAIAGCYGYRGAWNVMKIVGLERLEKNPEDKELLSYLWDCVNAGNCSSDELPATLSLHALLVKVVERGRITGAIEDVLSSCLFSGVSGNTFINLEWALFSTTEGRKDFGPLSIKRHGNVESMASYLMEKGYVKQADEDEKITFEKRVADNNEAPSPCDVTPDWADEVELPSDYELDGFSGALMNEVSEEGGNERGAELSEASLDAEIVILSTDSRRLIYSQVYKVLEALELKVSNLSIYARPVGDLVIDALTEITEDAIFNVTLMRGAEELISLIRQALDAEGLRKSLVRHADRIAWLIELLGDRNRGVYFMLYRVWGNPKYAVCFADEAAEEIASAEPRWWQKGFTISPSGSGMWKVFRRVHKGKLEPFFSEDVTFNSIKEANAALRLALRQSRVNILRSAQGSELYIANYLSGTAILNLNGALALDVESPAKTDIESAIGQRSDDVFSSGRIFPVNYHCAAFNKSLLNHEVDGALSPIVKSDSPTSLATRSLGAGIVILSKVLDVDVNTLSIDGDMDFVVSSAGVSIARLNEVPIFEGEISGMLGFIWGKCCYHYLKGRDPVAFTRWLDSTLIRQVPSLSDMDSIDGVIMDLEDAQSDILAWINQSVLDQLMEHVENPSQDGYLFCRHLYSQALVTPEASNLLHLLKDVTLLSGQFSSRCELTGPYSEAVRSGGDISDVFAGMVHQWIWQRSVWKGIDAYVAVGFGLNSEQVSYNLFPEKPYWSVHAKIEMFLGSMLTDIGQKQTLSAA